MMDVEDYACVRPRQFYASNQRPTDSSNVGLFVLSLNRPMMVTASRMHSILYNKAGARLTATRWQAVRLARYYGTYRSRLASWWCGVGANMSRGLRRNRNPSHGAAVTVRD